MRSSHELTPSVSVHALPTPVTFTTGDDLADALSGALAANGHTLKPHDVILVSSKVVSLCEGAVVTRTGGDLTDARRQLARQDATEIVADSPHVLITRTGHGFVAANGGIDASNVADNTQLLRLPDDPDASATALRHTLEARHNVTPLAVIITDTFGRPWRMGQTDVALGVSGMRALRDERGDTDLYGHVLDVTEAAVADALAGAGDLVRHKASGTPFVLIRGVEPALFAPDVTAGGQQLIRENDRDLFRFGGATAIENGLAKRRTVRQFDTDRPVPKEVLAAGVTAAVSVSAPHHSAPWRFVTLSDATRTVLLDRMARAWQADLERDGLDANMIARRLARSDAVLRTAPSLLVAFVDLASADTYPDRRRQQAEYDLFMLSGGAAIQNFQVALVAHDVYSAWISAPLFCADVIRSVLAVGPTYRPLGLLAAGYPTATPPAREPRDISTFWRER